MKGNYPELQKYPPHKVNGFRVMFQVVCSEKHTSTIGESNYEIKKEAQ